MEEARPFNTRENMDVIFSFLDGYLKKNSKSNRPALLMVAVSFPAPFCGAC